MPLGRIKEYPYPEDFKGLKNANAWARRLHAALTEEASERLQDFDILKLGNVPWVDVREYGAKGDGSTDDTVAVQAAITSLADTGGTIYFPHAVAGVYITLAPLVFPVNSLQIKLLGDAGVIIDSSGHTGDCIVLTGTNENFGWHTLEHLVLQGPNTHWPGIGYVPTSLGAGVNLTTAYKNSIIHCTIRGFKYGLYLQTGIANRLEGKSTILFNQYGILIDGGATNANIFTDFEVRNNWKRGITILGTGGSPYPTGNIFTDYLIESNTPYFDGYVAAAGDGSDSVGVFLDGAYQNIFGPGYHENHEYSFWIGGSADGSRISRVRLNPSADFTRLEKVRFDGAGVQDNIFTECTQIARNSTDVHVESDNANQPYNQFVDCTGFNFISGSLTTVPDVINNRPYGATFGTPHGTLSVPFHGYQNNVSEGTARGNIEDIGTSSATLNAFGLGDILLGNGITGTTTIDTISNLQRGQLLTIINYQVTHEITIKSSTDGIAGIVLDGKQDFIMKNYSDSITLYHTHLGKTVEVGRNSMAGNMYTASFTYDFSVHGGALGPINLMPLPDNATAIKAFYEQRIAFTSGGAATVSLGVATDDAVGILTATAFDNAIFATGYHDTACDGTATNFTTKTTAARYIIMGIAGAVLTAGKFKLWIEYIVSE